MFSVATDGSWRFKYLSKNIEKQYEVSVDDAYADHEAMTSCILPEDRGSHRSSVMAAVANKTEWSHLHRIRTPKGNIKWVHA